MAALFAVFAFDFALLALRLVLERDLVPFDEAFVLLRLFAFEPFELRFALAVLPRAELPFEPELRDFEPELRGLVFA